VKRCVTAVGMLNALTESSSTGQAPKADPKLGEMPPRAAHTTCTSAPPHLRSHASGLHLATAVYRLFGLLVCAICTWTRDFETDNSDQQDALARWFGEM
jgi:hypothetical protein